MSKGPETDRPPVITYAGPEQQVIGGRGVWTFLSVAVVAHVAAAIIPSHDLWVRDLYFLTLSFDVTALAAGGVALWRGVQRRACRSLVLVVYCAAMAVLAGVALLLFARTLPTA